MVTRKPSLATRAARLSAWTGVIALAFSLVTFCSQVYPRHDLEAAVTESFVVPEVTAMPAVRVSADVALWNDGHVDELVTDAGFLISNCSSGLSKGLRVYFVSPERKLRPTVISQGGKLSWSLDGTFQVQPAVNVLGPRQPQRCRTSTPSDSYLVYVVFFALQPDGQSLGIPIPAEMVDMKQLSQYLQASTHGPTPIQEYWNRPVKLVPGNSSIHLDPSLVLEELNRNKAEATKPTSR
jgi:hypothetical protein